MIRGSVDVVTTTLISGWAYAPGALEPVRLAAVLNHEVLGVADAVLYRPDLAAAGLGDGHSGYEIRLAREIDPIYLPFIAVKLDGGDVELPRALNLGFAEYFSSLYANHPALGRSRTLLGGLWTARTDAAALLRGKAATGGVDAAAIAPLRELIHEGFVKLALGSAPSEFEWRKALPDRVEAMLASPELLPVLQAMLEDRPLPAKSEWLDRLPLAQPSTRCPAPSPAECLELVVPFGDDVVLDVVRGSQDLPEFTPQGISRWTDHSASSGLNAAGDDGFLDSYPLEPGTAILLGPGIIYRVRCSSNSKFVLISCLPARNLTVTLAVSSIS